MVKIMKVVASLALLLLTYISFSQTYFSKRLNVGGKLNTTLTFKFNNDTFLIPSSVIEVNYNVISSSVLKVDKFGNIILQKRYKPVGVNFLGPNDLLVKKNKFYLCGETTYTNQANAGFYVFSEGCDTLFTKKYGDTTYWNNPSKIQHYLKTKDKLLIFGLTDSTCGPAHSGNYRVFVRVVDTNGVLYQTRLYLTNNLSRSLTGIDTTLGKGYIISGVQASSNYILKLDSNLNQQWVVILPNTTASIYNGIVTLKNGVHIIAHCKTDSSGGFNYYDRVGMTKLDVNGNIVWQKYYGIKQTNIGATNIKVLSNGDLIVCGSQLVKYNTSASQIMGYLMRTDSLGNLKWWNNYIATNPIKDTIGDCYLHNVVELPDKSISAVGYVFGSSFFGTIEQSWLLRVDSTGCLFSGCPSSTTGFAEDLALNNDLKMYPNPTSTKLYLKVSNLSEDMLFKIYDIIGKEIKSERVQKNDTGIDVGEINNGIYFVQLIKNGKIISVKKLVKE